jgi:iron transport multicopper oxidase
MLRWVALSFVYLSLVEFARAGTVTYNWNVTWVWASPDGVARPVIGINGQWPCPTMEATVGDTVVVNLHNKLGNQTTGLHFHGINHRHTPDMDGPSGVTQCPLPPDSSVKYQFTVDTPGSFWCRFHWQYSRVKLDDLARADKRMADHSHNMGQYPDGLRGPFIVHDPHDPYHGDYDEEYILTISDW